MGKFSKTIFIILVFSVIGSKVYAEVKLPSIIGSHMVLRQNQEVKVWGWCEPMEEVTIQTDWDTVIYKTKGLAIGHWTVALKTPGGGGPYTITIKGNNTIVLTDIMIGEVWVCGGQSNMQYSGSQGLKQSLDEMPDANNKQIRFFYVPRSASEYPQEDCKGSWVVCNPEDMKRFSAVGYFFGKKLQRDLQCPVGLINANWGGTFAEVWTPKEIIENDTLIKKYIGLSLVPAPTRSTIPSGDFNAMIYPLTNYNISGVIWYQGESNVSHYQSYQQLFIKMVGGWRGAWKQDFPFYYVQIAPFSGYGNNNIHAALLREMQTKCMSIPRSGMVVISDLVDDVKNIHPRNKLDVGLRLANYALAETYAKKGISYKSPTYKGMKVENNKIRIWFTNAENGIVSKGNIITGFYIAGNDKIFISAIAKIEENSVVVSNDKIKDPVAVRFGFMNASIPDLFSKDGLPVSIFRTDDWDNILTEPVPDLGTNAKTEWNFDTTTEGWLAHSLTTSVSSGVLNISTTGSNPYIVSPDNLGIDASVIKILKIRTLNPTNQPAYHIRWMTDQETWGVNKLVTVKVTPNLSIQKEYVFDFSKVTTWKGVVERIMIDFGNPPSGSTLAVDYIKLSN